MTPVPTIAEPPKSKAWHSQSGEKVLAQLGSAATGLSATDQQRQRRIGFYQDSMRKSPSRRSKR